MIPKMLFWVVYCFSNAIGSFKIMPNFLILKRVATTQHLLTVNVLSQWFPNFSKAVHSRSVKIKIMCKLSYWVNTLLIQNLLVLSLIVFIGIQHIKTC